MSKSTPKYALILSALLALTCTPGVAAAFEYASGVHRFETSMGSLSLISGKVTNGMRLYSHSYNLYFTPRGSKELFHMPMIDPQEPTKIFFQTNARAREERMVTDMKVEISHGKIYLIHAQSTKPNEIEDSPIQANVYHLVESDGDDWPYSFKKTSTRIYPQRPDQSVSFVIKQESAQIQKR